VLAGVDTLDDAAVYRLSDDLALVQTVDFITPIVDDPYLFGGIAAANALSDIYAMGARPILALNLLSFPFRSLPLSSAGEMVRGAADKAAEAGAALVGGHSIDDNEPKFGLAVVGLVHPKEVITNAKARPGDRLVVTKPLGLGIIATGIDRSLVREATIQRVGQIMASLNRGAGQVMAAVGVHACTDVSGFGLLGHLWEMLRASGCGARIALGRIPVLPEAWELVGQGIAPEGTHNNYRFLREQVSWAPEIGLEGRLVLCDAQTSGGLLMAVPPERLESLLEGLGQVGSLESAEIGEVVPGPAGAIEVLPQ
jgi:selenide,water dikinase